MCAFHNIVVVIVVFYHHRANSQWADLSDLSRICGASCPHRRVWMTRQGQGTAKTAKCGKLYRWQATKFKNLPFLNFVRQKNIAGVVFCIGNWYNKIVPRMGQFFS